MALKKKSTSKKSAKKTAAKKAPGARKGAAKKSAAKKAFAPRKKAPARKKALAPEAPAPVGPPENPRAHALARKIGHLLGDKKALDIVILDVRGMTSYADYVVVASGESDRQVSSMAEHILTQLKEQEGLRPMGSEGMQGGQWVLLDFGDVVVHLFLGEARSFYDLEGLWADAAREKIA
jgi:ribosome-associated protein